MDWKLADAKNKFSEVVNRALAEGPQRVFRRGDVVVVLSQADYQKLTNPGQGFKAYLRQGPGLEGLDLARDSSGMREAGL